MSTRAEPFYCPYCGEEDLRPHAATHGEWECRSCRRVFVVSFKGLLGPGTAEALLDAPPGEGG
jgi:transposase-like protein